ncbi:MAG: sugar phosphate isomerase/epimerase [Chloroflexota bacterium]
MSPLPIALQLYTVRRETHADFAGTVRGVAQMGYDGVEFAGYGGLSGREIRTLLDETGLRVAGSHVSWETLERGIEREIDYCRTIASPCLILASAPTDYRDNPADMAPFLELWGRRCMEVGISFGYHNHAFEFSLLEGRPALEVLMDRTDPDHVFFELDLYWTAFAGFDPYRFLSEHAERVRLVHFKDMTPARRFTEVGDGTLDLLSLYKEAPKLGVHWAIVENDEPVMPPLESARRSLRSLRSARQ